MLMLIKMWRLLRIQNTGMRLRSWWSLAQNLEGAQNLPRVASERERKEIIESNNKWIDGNCCDGIWWRKVTTNQVFLNFNYTFDGMGPHWSPKKLAFLASYFWPIMGYSWRQISSISSAEKVDRKEIVSGLATRGPEGWRKLIIRLRFLNFLAGKRVQGPWFDVQLCIRRGEVKTKKLVEIFKWPKW